jgi:hypothetical protein
LGFEGTDVGFRPLFSGGAEELFRFFFFGGGSESISTESSLSEASTFIGGAALPFASESSLSDSPVSDLWSVFDFADLLRGGGALIDFVTFDFGAVACLSSSLSWRGGGDSASSELDAGRDFLRFFLTPSSLLGDARFFEEAFRGFAPWALDLGGEL